MGLHFETPESGPAYAAIRSKRMKKSLITIALAICAFSANAACTGSGSYRYCTDSSGNSYTVQQYGNTTYTQGSNASTGSTWNQTGSTYGNTTYHNGTAANGNSWSGTSSTYGNTTYHSGTDSRGRSYSGSTYNNR